MAREVDLGVVIPSIGSNGNWYVGTNDLGKPSRGATGSQGPKGDTGAQGPQGKQGNTGPAGTTPTIGSNGNWYLGATDTGKPSRGVQGPQGAKGEKGDTGAQGPQGPKGDTGPQPSLSNTLTSTSTTVALTAAQGKALNDKITNILNGVSAPMTEV